MSQKRITIRPLRLTDADDIHEIMHMPNVLWGTSVLPSRTVDAWRKSVEGWVTDERVHVFVAEVNGKVVGVIRLAVEEGRASHVGNIALAVHDASQGQGIGNMLMLTVIDLADNWLNLVRLEVNVYTDNERAIRLCEHFDFEIEGKKHCNVFRGGDYIDSYIMGRVRLQHPQQARANYAEVLTPIPSSQPQPEPEAESESAEPIGSPEPEQ
jgi:L-phenylalanine/L-methionine N-acetyltransferase